MTFISRAKIKDWTPLQKEAARYSRKKEKDRLRSFNSRKADKELFDGLVGEVFRLTELINTYEKCDKIQELKNQNDKAKAESKKSHPNLPVRNVAE